MPTETQLWAWFLFGSTLSPQRGKGLLKRWQDQNLSLGNVLSQLPQRAADLGLTPAEAKQLASAPAELPTVTALRWDESLYPHGLRTLPLKLRPALLFYRGTLHHLQRPITYLLPASLDPIAQEDIANAISLLLGDSFLPAAFIDSPQATLLLEEMLTTEGDALLFARQGLNTLQLTPTVSALLDAGRLLIISPLPQEAAKNPAWDPYLEQLTFAAATHCITTTLGAIPEKPQGTRPRTLLLGEAPPSGTLSPGTQVLEVPEEILMWITMPSQTTPAVTSPAVSPAPARPLVQTLPEEPPPSPEEMLRTLESGGRVPEALRKKLMQS